MLKIQVKRCLPKDIQIFFKVKTVFLSQLYKALIESQIATVTGMGRGLLTICSSRVGGSFEGDNSRIYGTKNVFIFMFVHIHIS